MSKKAAESSEVIEDSKNVQEAKVEQKPEVNPETVQQSKPTEIKQETHKKKKKGLKLAIIISSIVVVLVGLLLAGYFFLLPMLSASSSNKKSVDGPLIYTTKDGELKIVLPNKKDPIVINDSVKSKSVSAVLSNTSDRYVLYTYNDNLYLADLNKKSYEEKIASEVEYFEFSNDDKYILYINDDNNLYSHNFKEKEKLDSDVSYVEEIVNGKVFYKKDGNLYMRSVDGKGDKVKIATDYKTAYINEKATKVLYSKYSDGEYTYYVYTIKGEKNEKVLSNISSLIDYDDNFTEFIYEIENDGQSVNLKDFVEDDKADYDKNFKEYSYSDYWNDKITYDEYWENYREASKVASRNNLRQKLDSKYELSSSYDIYYQKGDDKVKLASNVDRTLYTDVKTKTVAYLEKSVNTSKKVKISEIDDIYDVRSYIRENMKSAAMITTGENESVLLYDDEIEDDIDVYVINKDIYFVVDDELFYTKFSGSKLETPTSLDDDVDILDYSGDYKNSLVYLADYKNSGGDLKYVKSGKATKIDYDVYTAEVIDSNKLLYYKDYSKRSGDVYIYTNKSKKLLTDVYFVRYIKDNLMYVFKDYSSKTETADLYKYTGSSKLTLIDYSLSGVLN